MWVIALFEMQLWEESENPKHNPKNPSRIEYVPRTFGSDAFVVDVLMGVTNANFYQLDSEYFPVFLMGVTSGGF